MKSLSKQDPETENIPDKCLLKKWYLSSCNENNMRWMQEIILIKGCIQRVEAEVQEASIRLTDLLHEIQQV